MSHKQYRQEKTCLNCGSYVDKKFCPECGQENLETHENFFHVVSHFISDYLHYDSKFLKSIGLLFTRPGFLTKEYLEGKRVSYIHPLRLFFFVTIVMVLVAGAYYNKFSESIRGDHIKVEMDSVVEAKMISRYDLNALSPEEREIINNVAKAFDKISHNLKYISFFLLPIYAFAFKMLYWRRRIFYVDHVIYTLHVQSFAYIILSVLLLIPLFISPSAMAWFDDVFLLIVAIYLVLSLRYLYHQSWVKTILKAGVATIFIVAVTVLVAAGFILVAFLKAGYLS